MKRFLTNRSFAVIAIGVLATAAIAQISLKNILKAGGAVAVVSAFGKDINNGFNKLWNRKEERDVKTKVVVILTVGKGTAIGAAQVMGPPDMVDDVVAVAQPEMTLLGVRLRALIPIANKNTGSSSGLSIVKGVGVSGIVDLRL